MKSFLGVGPKVQPRHGKFDFFMKAYHWGIAGCLVILGHIGHLSVEPLRPHRDDEPRASSTLEVSSTTSSRSLLVGLIAMHIYFGVEPINWPILRSMVTGTISGEVYNHDYDSSRWPLKKPKAVASPPVTTTTTTTTTTTVAATENKIAPPARP